MEDVIFKRQSGVKEDTIECETGSKCTYIRWERKREEKKSLGVDLRWAKNPHKYKLNLRIPHKETLRFENAVRALGLCSLTAGYDPVHTEGSR
jgi:hypothetical protein